MKLSGIYCFRNVLTDKVYVGQSVDVSARKTTHLWALASGRHPNVHLQSSFLRYGADSFEFRILELAPENMLDVRERAWISFYDSTSPSCGYNSETGGHRHKHLSAEHKAKLSVANRASPRLAQHIRDLAEQHTGKHLSAATRAKIAASHRGMHPSAEAKKKMSAAKLRDPFTLVHCRALAAAREGISTGPRSLAVKQKISMTKRLRAKRSR